MTTTTFTDAELELIDRALMMLSTKTAEEYRLANSALSRIAAIQAERVAERKAQAEAEAAAKAREAERQALIQAHDLAPPMVEIQISADSDFSRKGFSRKVYALGGNFTECRGKQLPPLCHAADHSRRPGVGRGTSQGIPGRRKAQG